MVAMTAPSQTHPFTNRYKRYGVSVHEYSTFRKQGFLVVRGLVPPEDIAELRQHTEDLMQGKLPEQQMTMAERDLARDGGVTIQGLEAPPAHLSPAEKAQYFLRSICCIASWSCTSAICFTHVCWMCSRR
jgi:phytanoyl-CoA hydroxylase